MAKGAKRPLLEHSGLTQRIFTHAHLFRAAKLALAQAETEGTKGKDKTSFSMTAILFCAFTLEAYLNFLGTEKLPSLWEQLERLTPETKLDLILHTIGHAVDKTAEPFSSFNPLFRVRNELVHGKTRSYTTERPQAFKDGKNPPTFPAPEWVQLCNVEKAKQLLNNTDCMIQDLQGRAGLKGDPLAALAVADSYIPFPSAEAIKDWARAEPATKEPRNELSDSDSI